jgi:MFS transporter, ACS family, glucarate transporter
LRKRTGVLALLCGVSAITFLDRLAIAVAEPGIRADLKLTPERWGWVLSAYVLSNALFEIPSGARGDRRGQRSELTRIAVWWSGFTAATGWCRTFAQMAGARFLFGVGAAGAYPNAAGVVSRWFPREEHARAQGFIWAAGRLGAALAPLLLVPLERVWGWRAIFWLMGAVGLVWSAAWWMWFRSAPEEMPGISEAELVEIHAGLATRASHDGVPWRRLLGLPQLWLVVAAYFCYAWGSWFFFSWFTTWMVLGAGFTVAQMGLFASFPFVMAMFGNLIGGALSERLVQRVGAVRAYRWVTSVCLAVGAALLLGMSVARGHVAIVVLATVAFGVMDLMLPSAWAMCMGLGGRFGGTATAVMNTAGNLGGWFCAVLFGYAVKATGNYNLPLRAIVLMVVVAAVLFSRVDCSRGLGES